MSYEKHKATELFPMIGADEFEALKRDIAENGQREPITLVAGEVIDGRNRLRACEELGIEPLVRNLTAQEAEAAGGIFGLVMSLNFHRRHLRPHEKGEALAAYMRSVGARKQGRKRTDRSATESVADSPTVKDVARQLGVAEQTARDHLKAAEDYAAAAPEHKAKVDAGEITPRKARKLTEGEGKKVVKLTGKRAEIMANAARERAADFVGRIEGVPGFCEKVTVEAIRSDERLLRHWREASKNAINALRALLRKLED